MITNDIRRKIVNQWKTFTWHIYSDDVNEIIDNLQEIYILF